MPETQLKGYSIAYTGDAVGLACDDCGSLIRTSSADQHNRVCPGKSLTYAELGTEPQLQDLVRITTLDPEVNQFLFQHHLMASMNNRRQPVVGVIVSEHPDGLVDLYYNVMYFETRVVAIHGPSEMRRIG